MGTDRLNAIDAAKQLNGHLMQGYDLVSSVMGVNFETLEGFIASFR